MRKITYGNEHSELIGIPQIKRPDRCTDCIHQNLTPCPYLRCRIHPNRSSVEDGLAPKGDKQ